jgi:hypothetical protein
VEFLATFIGVVGVYIYFDIKQLKTPILSVLSNTFAVVWIEAAGEEKSCAKQ